MRKLQFNRTHPPVMELLESQLGAALQVIAALILSPEEGAEMSNGVDREWISSMKRELLNEYWRSRLIQALKNQSWMTNTNPGYMITYLEEPPCNHSLLKSAYESLEFMLQEYAEGYGPDVYKSETYEAVWTQKLVDMGYPVPTAEWVLRHDGACLVAEAGCERLMIPHRTEDEKPKHTRSAVVVVRNEKNQILLLKRKPEDRAYTGWCFPGGKLDTKGGEELEQTAIREVHEETGLEVKILRRLPGVDSESPKSGRLFKITPFLATVEEGSAEVNLSEEHESYGWFSLEEALFEHRTELAGPATKRILEVLHYGLGNI